MDAHTLIPVLMLFTFGAVIGFALWSKKKTEDRLEDPSAPSSTLAADTPDRQ